jgi:hypothetical protein
MKCRTCGGERTADHCNLCDLFANGISGTGHQPSCWPMKSLALGCHPNQVEEITARNRKHGVNVSYDRFGRALIPDRGERKKLLKLEQLHDNNGCYGD